MLQKSLKDKNSMIKIFAKEPKTDIYRDHQKIGFIRNAGGVEGVGYIMMRADDNEPRPVVIGGDKPISVTQFNTGQSDDNVPSDPFQLVLTPIEQYQNEIIFNTPGIRGGAGFPKNYINICYEATEYGTIPEDLEFAQVEAGEFVWQKMVNLDPNPGSPFHKVNGGKNYYSKTLLLPGDGVYKLRSSKPFAAYAYGFSSWDSYGFPTSVALGDLTIIDTLPPEPEWLMDCEGNVNATTGTKYVTDKPDDPENRSNLSTVYMHSEVSYNYILEVSDFMPCEDERAAWKLETIDPTEDALAVVTFTDCAGNDTTLFIEYNAPDIKLVEKEYDFGRHSVGQTSWHMFHLINESSTAPWTVTEINLKQKDLEGNPQGFTLWNETKTGPLQFPITIPPLDSLHFWVQFNATAEGEFWDSIGFGDTCFFYYKSYVQADVGMPVIDVSDWNFPPTNVGGTNYGEFTIKNIGSVNLEIYDYEGPSLVGQKSGLKIYDSQELVDANITPQNPLILAPNKSRTFQLRFRPDDTLSYPDEIRFISNTSPVTIQGDPADSICVITGRGLRSELKATSYNWERKRIDRPQFPAGPYPAVINATNSDTCIRLVNDGNTPVTILRLKDIATDGDITAFNFDRSKLVGAIIPAKGELIVPVTFQPKAVGTYLYTFEYETDNSSIVGVQTTLQGIGIVPNIATLNYDFGKTIINDFNNVVEKDIVIYNLSLNDYQWGDSVTITGLNEVNAYTDITVEWDQFTEPFRYDKDPIVLPFPIVLQPGDTLHISSEFVARDGNAVQAMITTISDAEQDVTSTWIGSGLVPNATATGDQTTICLGMTDILQVELNNTGESNLSINNISLSNTADFEFVDPTIVNGFTMNPGDTRTIEIKFTANNQGVSTCQFSCEATPYLTDVNSPAPWNIPLTADLQGTVTHYTRDLRIDSDPPENQLVPIDAYLIKKIILEPGSDLNGSQVTGFLVNVNYNGDFLKLADQGGITLGSMFDSYGQGNYGYEIINKNDQTGNLQIEIKRQNSAADYITSPEGGELLVLKLGTYLPKVDTRYSDFTVEVSPVEEYGTCVDVTPAQSSITIDSTCVFNVRKVVFTGGNFYLSTVKPNPVTGNQAVIEFEVANEDCQTRIEVYNSNNQLVAVPVNELMQPGRYEVSIDVRNWSSGSYYYIMKAGPYEEQRRMIIAK